MSAFRYVQALLIGASVLAAKLLWAQVRVVDSGPAHLRVVYEVHEADPMAAHGCRRLVGLPLEGQVSLEVVEARVARQEKVAGKVEPLPGPAFLGHAGFVRGQRVVELVFAPQVQEDGLRKVYDRVVVDLRFSGIGQTYAALADARAEDFYGQVLINREQARKWRLPPRARRAAKGVVQDDGMKFLRLYVREGGLYRVTGRELSQAGVELGTVEPQGLKLFYGGGRMLPIEEFSPPLELREMGVVVEDGGDGRLDEEDFVLFYGEPIERWEYSAEKGQFEYVKNLYTRENAYWLGMGAGGARRQLDTRDGSLRQAQAQRPTSYRVRLHQEVEQFVLAQTYSIKSGYDWYWEDFSGNARNYPTVVRAAVDEPVDLRLGFIGVEGKRPRLTIKWNEERVGEVAFISSRPVVRQLRISQGPQEGLNQLGLFHENTETARLDWYELEYSRGLVAERGELNFTSPVQEGVAEFHLSGFGQEKPRLFEVSTDLVEIVEFAYDAEKGTVVFQDRAGEVPRHYVAAGPSRWKRVERLEADTPGRLLEEGLGADYVVIYHADFREAAERLAQWRAADDRFGQPLRALALDVQDMYDAFSGGLLDPAAIRSFLHYAAEHWERAPFFVTLLGDGSYDYKNNSGTSRGNWIPPYQEGDSTYDEWYVRTAGDDVLPDMAIGRLTVQTQEEAERVVEKLIEYDRQPEAGPWQSRVLLIADDLSNPEDPSVIEGYFILDSEFMAARLLPEDLDLTKLYLAQFPLEGRTKPRAREEFIKRFNEGALILTFLGHSNPDVLTHEQMFVVSRDLGEIKNGGRLPLFYTSSSQAGVFDDPVRTSMPEALLKLKDGGVIGMISATRVGFHESNMALANVFHRQMYRSQRSHVPVGQALMEAKQMVQVGEGATERRNVQRYSLFGDPATRLARPRYQVRLEVADSLRALEEVAVRGQVLDPSGEPAEDFAGQVWVQAFDSTVQSRLEGFLYQQPGVPLFRARLPVQGGRFTTLFRVPKDITYGGLNGRLSAYAWSGEKPAAFGAVDGLVLSGTAFGVEQDQEGPEIAIGFVGRERFASGGAIGQGAVLRAVIRDPGGINVTGETGHEIELGVDEEVFKVTEFFSAREDYREGVVEFPLPVLEPGEHAIRLKAWDSFNNSSRVELVVRVKEGGDAGVGNALFHPNPLRGDAGHFTYELEEEARRVRIQVFSLAGRLVDEVEGDTREGFNQVAWNPPADLANGAYLYKVVAEGQDGALGERRAVVQIAR